MITSIVSSGVTGIATTSDDAVEAISAANAKGARNAKVVNTAAAAGFVSFDGGSQWHYLPAATATVPYTQDYLNIPVSGAVQIKRVASGSNLTAFVSLWV